MFSSGFFIVVTTQYSCTVWSLLIPQFLLLSRPSVALSVLPALRCQFPFGHDPDHDRHGGFDLAPQVRGKIQLFQPPAESLPELLSHFDLVDAVFPDDSQVSDEPLSGVAVPPLARGQHGDQVSP
jgi:hypothetical protein